MRTESRLTLQQLRHLVLLADELHFARAAERACLSQSAFSRSIAALEEAAGFRIFDRGPRFVLPTADGARVIERARVVLSSSAGLARELTMLRSGDLGALAVGAGPFTATAFMPIALSKMARLHPDVPIRLKVDVTGPLVAALRAEALDFFVADLAEFTDGDDLQVEVLGRLVGGLYCRAGHPLAAKAHLRLGDIRGARFALPHMLAPYRRLLGELFAAPGNDGPSVALECESLAVLREFVLRSDCLMIATRGLFERELVLGHIHELRVEELDAPGADKPISATVGLVRLRDRTPSTAARILMDIVLEEAPATYLPIEAPAPPGARARDRRPEPATTSKGPVPSRGAQQRKTPIAG